MKRLLVWVAAICIGISFTGCGEKSVSTMPTEKTIVTDCKKADAKIENTEEFIKQLEKSGCKIKSNKENKKSLLSGSLTIIELDGDTIGAYEYKSNQEMELEAKTISGDGSMIRNEIYEFKSKPHFYKSGNVIVIYIGDNKETIKKVEKLLGQQFAGMK